MSREEFSPKQIRAMTWWTPEGRDARYEAIICDGAVRSGKTLCLGLGFFLWAMLSFDRRQFALCGKTRASLRRNLLPELCARLEKIGIQVVRQAEGNELTARFGKRENRFYLFGGCDERSAALIQGVTLAGVLLDEAALMPRSFVEQACARCSVEGSRIWFSCNPAGPQHWFYREWICRAEEKGCLHLHFTMEDNPAMTRRMRERYRKMYTGAFYERFVLGLWTAAEGRVYDFYDVSQAVRAPDGPWEQWHISCDYGTVNPASFGLWGRCRGVWYRTAEFYYDSRREGKQMTDAEYARALRRLAGGRSIRSVIVDPSAASFIETLRREGWNVRKADNEVLAGIRRTADALKSGKIVICEQCADCLREMELYVWDRSGGGDRVKKENDHAMDDMRYFVTGVLTDRSGFSARAVARGAENEGIEVEQ